MKVTVVGPFLGHNPPAIILREKGLSVSNSGCRKQTRPGGVAAAPHLGVVAVFNDV